MTDGVRDPIEAGRLYSDDAQQLRTDIDELLSGVQAEFSAPKALVLPHGNLADSGDVSAAGYSLLPSERGRIKRVVLLGSVASTTKAVTVPKTVAFRTPLGDLLLDQDALRNVSRHQSVLFDDHTHAKESCLEVHLPFIQRLLGDIRIVPLLVGRASADVVTDILERVWGGPETLIVITSDFLAGDSGVSVVGDVLALRDDRVSPDRATGAVPLSALLRVARRRALGVLELGSETTTDQAGRTIEMASFGLWESPLARLEPAEEAHLRELTLSAVRTTILGGKVIGTNNERIPPGLTVRRASFVSLRRDGQLRGSVGEIEAERSLASSIVRHATAACSDPRMPSVQPSELADLHIDISIVGPLERLLVSNRAELWSVIEPGRHGIVVSFGEHRSTFVPAVWKSIPEPDQFLDRLLANAGIDGSVPLSDLEVHRYETIDY